MVILAGLEAFLEPLGAILAPLGVILAPLGAILAPLGVILEALGAVLEPLGTLLGRSWSSQEATGDIDHAAALANPGGSAPPNSFSES